MNETIAAVRLVHIGAGFLAFVVAPAALVTAKGGVAHRRWGKLYFWSMAVVALTAVVLALWRPVEWLAHMGGMLGSYVATVSAFSAVNFTFLPLTARFLWPAAVGVPLIFAWVAYYRACFSRRAVAAVAA